MTKKATNAIDLLGWVGGFAKDHAELSSLAAVKAYSPNPDIEKLTALLQGHGTAKAVQLQATSEAKRAVRQVARKGAAYAHVAREHFDGVERHLVGVIPILPDRKTYATVTAYAQQLVGTLTNNPGITGVDVKTLQALIDEAMAKHKVKEDARLAAKASTQALNAEAKRATADATALLNMFRDYAEFTHDAELLKQIPKVPERGHRSKATAGGSSSSSAVEQPTPGPVTNG